LRRCAIADSGGVIVAVTAEEREGDVGLAEFRGILGSILSRGPDRLAGQRATSP
jgi:hypothetical protein